jgi:four helix bundle protein
MIAKTLEELQVYQRSRELGAAVTAILERAAFQKDHDLRDQIRRAADSVVSNIAEGFAEPTDRAFAQYLFHAKASNSELRARLKLACDRRYLSEADIRVCDNLADQVAAMSTGLIKHLVRSNRRNRGLGLGKTQRY